MWSSRPSHFMIIPNTKRHPNNTKTDQLPIYEVISGLPKPYHNKSERRPKEAAGPGLTSTLLPRNLEEETQHEEIAKIFLESHGPGRADHQ